MHAIEHTYVSLLADVANKSGFREIRGSYEGLHWSINDAPKLEKLVLNALESGVEPDLQLFPTWLRRLVVASLVDPIMLRYLRQLLLFSYKTLVTHDKPTTEKAFQGFIDCNASVGSFGNGLSGQSPVLLDAVRKHCQSVISRVDFAKAKPAHGPGASTTSKEVWTRRYWTIDRLFPQSDWFGLYYNQDHCAELERSIDEDIIEAKVIAVPKDSRGPRLICVHPAEAIWIQQAIRVQTERAIALMRSSYGPWPRGRVRFDDQSVNGKIALKSSLSRKYATLDLKEASDRISEPLVQVLFGSLYKYFGCCRAQRFVIPGSGNTAARSGWINSYAPMGNATTFPVQSLVFWAICVASMQRHGFHQPGAAFVFGDDICIPTEAVGAVIDGLESFGLIVNREKSYWRGAFRESCGVDAFNGVNVTPVRWKTSIDAEDVAGLQSLSDLGMRLRISGYEEAAATCYSILRARLRCLGKDLFFSNNPHHGGLAEFTPSGYLAFRDSYWDRNLHWFHTRVWRLESRPAIRSHSGWNHVLESVLSLERTGRSSVPVRDLSRGPVLKRGWIQVL